MGEDGRGEGGELALGWDKGGERGRGGGRERGTATRGQEGWWKEVGEVVGRGGRKMAHLFRFAQYSLRSKRGSQWHLSDSCWAARARDGNSKACLPLPPFSFPALLLSLHPYSPISLLSGLLGDG